MTEQEYWDCKDQFRETLEKMKDDFINQLPFSKDTKRKYEGTLWWMIEYLYGYTKHLEIKNILPGDVVSRFHNHTQYDFDFPATYKKYILHFFLFLKEEGYTNEQVIKHLSKK